NFLQIPLTLSAVTSRTGSASSWKLGYTEAGLASAITERITPTEVGLQAITLIGSDWSARTASCSFVITRDMRIFAIRNFRSSESAAARSWREQSTTLRIPRESVAISDHCGGMFEAGRH